MMPKNQRQAKRLMDRLGMQVETMPDVNQVIIKTSSKDIIIDGPEVTLTHIQGQNIYQIIGGSASEVTEIAEKEVKIPEEDVHLVAQQTNTSLDISRKALEETGGDLAQAIMLLTQRKTS